MDEVEQAENLQEQNDTVRAYFEQKESIPSFFTKVVQAKDTTKTGNLTQEELGFPNLPVRTYKELSTFCNKLINKPKWADYFDAMSENQTSTSLSKNAILLQLVTTSNRVQKFQDITQEKKENRGWFGKKNKEQPVSAY